MKPTQQQEKLKKQSIHSVMTITSMEYHTDLRMRIWNFRPKGDGRSGPLGPLLPVKNLTFWYT